MTVERHDEIGSLAPEWDALADRSGGLPWLRPGWIEAWWKAFGRGTLEIVTVRNGPLLTGVLPLACRSGEARSPANWHTPEFGMLAEGAEAATTLAGALVAGTSRRVTLGFVDASAPSMETWLEVAHSAGYRTIVRDLERSPYVPISEPWSEYESGLGGKLRRELRRRRRRLEAQGALTVDVEDGSIRLDDLLEEGMRVEASGWKGRGRTAMVSRHETLRFYSDVGRWAASRGWLRLAYLRLDGKALAFDYCIEEGGHHYLLKTGFDPDYATRAPGLILRYEMIKRAFERGLESYEFLGDEDAWKRPWAQMVRRRALVHAFAPTAVGTMDWAVYAYGRPLAKRAVLAAKRLRRRPG